LHKLHHDWLDIKHDLWECEDALPSKTYPEVSINPTAVAVSSDSSSLQDDLEAMYPDLPRAIYEEAGKHASYEDAMDFIVSCLSG
jgi:hypothetical protein